MTSAFGTVLDTASAVRCFRLCGASFTSLLKKLCTHLDLPGICDGPARSFISFQLRPVLSFSHILSPDDTLR